MNSAFQDLGGYVRFAKMTENWYYTRLNTRDSSPNINEKGFDPIEVSPYSPMISSRARNNTSDPT